jgi:hypothetical protein
MRALHIYCDGGFGNRFNGLVAGLLIARATGLEPLVVWPRNNWCGAGYGGLIENAATVLDCELAEYAPERDRYHFFMSEDHLKMGVPNLSPLLTATPDAMRQWVGMSTKDVFFHTPLIPAFLGGAEVLAEVAALRLRRSLVARAETFIASHGLTDFLGLQIRKTDFGANGADDQKLFELVSQCPHKRFFVCSDDAAVEARFATLPNVVTHAKRAYVEKAVDGGWNTPTADHSGRVYACNVNRGAAGVEDAIVDLLILSRSQIVRTSNSTFLNTALLIKQAKALAGVQAAVPARLATAELAVA